MQKTIVLTNLDGNQVLGITNTNPLSDYFVASGARPILMDAPREGDGAFFFDSFGVALKYYRAKQSEDNYNAVCQLNAKDGDEEGMGAVEKIVLDAPANLG